MASTIRESSWSRCTCTVASSRSPSRIRRMVAMRCPQPPCSACARAASRTARCAGWATAATTAVIKPLCCCSACRAPGKALYACRARSIGNSNDLFHRPRAHPPCHLVARPRCPRSRLPACSRRPALERLGLPAPRRPAPATPARQRLAQPCRQLAGRRPAPQGTDRTGSWDGQPARLGLLGGGCYKRLGGTAANAMRTA
jgi:hypothetical protein